MLSINFFRVSLILSLFLLPAFGLAQEVSLTLQDIGYQCRADGDLAVENLIISRSDAKKIVGKAEQSLQALQAKLKKEKKRKKKLRKQARSNSKAKRKLKKSKKKLKLIKQLFVLFQDCLAALEKLKDPGGGENCDNSNFETVSNILETNCMSCHGNESTSPVGAFQLDAPEWLIANNLITPGDHTQSELYLRLAENPEGIGVQNMPYTGDALSQQDIASIRCWINSLTPPPGDGDDNGGEEEPAFSFFCDQERDPAVMPLMRLSRTQYEKSIVQLLEPLAALSADYLDIRNKVQNELNLLPPDHVAKAFLEERDLPNNDNSYPQTLLDGAYRIAALIGAEVNSNYSRRVYFSGCDMASPGIPQSCSDDFIDSFGRKVFRRPLTTSERTRFTSFFASRPETSRLADTVLLFLMQPNFLFHVEIEGQPVEGKQDLYHLTPYEKAARLSFALWNEPPSNALLDAAAAGSLDTEAGFRQIVDSMFTDSSQQRTRGTIHEFWQHHLELDTVPPIDASNTSSFSQFKAGLDIDPGGDSLLTAMKQEMLDLTDYHTFDNPGNYQDLMRSTSSVTENPTLAAIYGVAPRQSGGPVVQLPERRSLLERAIMLVSGNWRNLPVKRGGRMYRLFMCNPLSPPPPEAEEAAMIPPPDPGASTRETYTNLTAQPLCMTCHSKINPIGFAMEKYDALGRSRTHENIYDDVTGQVLATHAVNTASEAQLVSGSTQGVSGPEQLIDAALETGKMDACLSQQYYRYINRRREDLLADGCALEQMRQALTASDGSLASFFKEAVLTEMFQLKKAAP